MSILDHLDRTADHGFTRRIDPGEAQRQFNLSLALVAVLALATITVALTLKVEALPHDQNAIGLLVKAPQFTQAKRAVQEQALRPGG